MKILFEKYNPLWKQTFEKMKSELTDIISFANPQIEHIGSTSVEGLSAKPIIDILIGLQNEDDLDKITRPLMDAGYVYYQKYNEAMPYRRFFVKHKVDSATLSIPNLIGKDDIISDTSTEHDYRLAHIHAIPVSSEHWVRHIAFRDYLRAHSDTREDYQHLKEQLSLREWKDGNEYNEGKDEFIKHEEQQAIAWYMNTVKVISVRQNPEYKDAAIRYFQQSWSEVSPMMYEDSITHCIGAKNPLPQWYLLEKGVVIIGCAGLITNDFISRGELYPWFCALYIDKNHRGKGYPTLLMDKAKEDAADMGFSSMYLCTDHIGYYERYGFSHIGQGYHPWDEESRIYEIKF